MPFAGVIQDRLGLEIMRGCTQGCRFCQAGYWYRPVREHDPAQVVERLERQIDETGFEEIGLLSLSSADYSQVEPLVYNLADRLSDRRVSVNLPSLRADSFSVGLAEAVSRVRKSGFTFAPETGSDRLRRVINKTFTNADMIKAAEAAFSKGWNAIKVYAMIGLPTETDDDLEELAILAENLAKAGRRIRGRKVEIKVSVGCFIPKAWTPVPVAAVYRPRRAAAPDPVPPGSLPADQGNPLQLVGPGGGGPRGAAFTGRAGAQQNHRTRSRRGSGFRRLDRFPQPRRMAEGGRCDRRRHQAGTRRARHRRDPALGRHRRRCPQGLPQGRVAARRPRGRHRGLQVGPLLPLRDPRRRRGHPTRGLHPAAARRDHARGRIARRPPPTSCVPSLGCRPRPGSNPRRRSSTAIASASPRWATRGISRTARSWTPSSGRFAAGRVPVRYTEGYNPHIRLSMGPALSVGHEGEAELFDVDCTSQVRQQHITAVNRLLPHGIEIIDAKPLLPGCAVAREDGLRIAVPHRTHGREAGGPRHRPISTRP